MFSRHGFVASVALLTGLVLCPAPVLAGNQSGLAYGAWDLPASEREPGWAYGYLFEANTYRIQYVFVAELQERPNPGTNLRAGSVVGLLYESDAPAARPIYYVDGRWSGPRNGAQGTWSATLYSLETFLPVGQMRGEYNDPAPFQVGRWGEFSGGWRIRD